MHALQIDSDSQWVEGPSDEVCFLFSLAVRREHRTPRGRDRDDEPQLGQLSWTLT